MLNTDSERKFWPIPHYTKLLGVSSLYLMCNLNDNTLNSIEDSQFTFWQNAKCETFTAEILWANK